MAGLAAAIRVAENNADVTALEKTRPNKKGWQTRYTESFCAPSTNCDIADQGYEFDVPDYSPQDFYNDIMHQTDGKANPNPARRVSSSSDPEATASNICRNPVTAFSRRLAHFGSVMRFRWLS